MGTTNCSKLYVSVVAGALAVACLTGCTQMKYTIHLDPSVQSAKLPASTIAVFPVNNLSYEPPRGCMGDAGIAPGSQEEYQNNWNRKIAGTLGGMFPSQKFVFLSEGNGILASGGADVYGITEQSKRAARAQQINQMKSDAPVYESMITSGEMQSLLQPVADSTGEAYAIVFVTPALTGSITTNYNAGPNGGALPLSAVYFSCQGRKYLRYVSLLFPIREIRIREARSVFRFFRFLRPLRPVRQGSHGLSFSGDR